MSRPARLALVAAVVVALALVPFWAPGYKTTLATEMLIFALLAMSVDILEGYAGRTTLCHGALFGVAAYVLLYHVIASGRTRPRMPFSPPVTVLPLSDSASFYYFVFGAFLVLAALMWRFVNSPFGRSLQGIRENETRMRALGYNVPLHLFIGFVVSGFFAGAAGTLYGFFNNFVSPAGVGLSQSVAGLLMALVGGAGTLFGGLIGAVIIISLQVFVSEYTERWSMVLGAMFILIIILAPEGVIGKVRQLFERSRPAT